MFRLPHNVWIHVAQAFHGGQGCHRALQGGALTGEGVVLQQHAHKGIHGADLLAQHRQQRGTSLDQQPLGCGGCNL